MLSGIGGYVLDCLFQKIAQDFPRNQAEIKAIIDRRFIQFSRLSFPGRTKFPNGITDVKFNQQKVILGIIRDLPFAIKNVLQNFKQDKAIKALLKFNKFWTFLQAKKYSHKETVQIDERGSRMIDAIIEAFPQFNYRIPKVHIIKNHFGPQARIWGELCSSRTGTLENSLICFAKQPYKYTSKKDYYQQFCKKQSFDYVDKLCRPAHAPNARKLIEDKIFIGKKQITTVRDLVGQHPKKNKN